MLNEKFYKLSLNLIIFAHITKDAIGQDLENALTSGFYIPELFKQNRGKYKPDPRGQYIHIEVPYNGGYGDRGIAYQHVDDRHIDYEYDGKIYDENNKATDEEILRNIIKQLKLPQLGAKDHLRVSFDFNYNKSDWQIAHLDWVRDDDEVTGKKAQLNLTSEKKLWSSKNKTNEAATEKSTNDSTTEEDGLKETTTLNDNDETIVFNENNTVDNNEVVQNSTEGPEIQNSELSANISDTAMEYVIQTEKTEPLLTTDKDTAQTTDKHLVAGKDTMSFPDEYYEYDIKNESTPFVNDESEIATESTLVSNDSDTQDYSDEEEEDYQFIGEE